MSKRNFNQYLVFDNTIPFIVDVIRKWKNGRKTFISFMKNGTLHNAVLYSNEKYEQYQLIN